MHQPFRIDDLIDIIAEKMLIDKHAVTPQSHLVNDLGVQSVDLIKIVMAVEDRYGLELEDIDQDAMGTVNQAYDALAEMFQQVH